MATKDYYGSNSNAYTPLHERKRVREVIVKCRKYIPLRIFANGSNIVVRFSSRPHSGRICASMYSGAYGTLTAPANQSEALIMNSWVPYTWFRLAQSAALLCGTKTSACGQVSARMFFGKESSSSHGGQKMKNV
jgi:hypothetical protein